MLNIKSIFDFAANSMRAGENRFQVLDSSHIMDTVTGVEYHLYDDYAKFTRGDTELMTTFDMTPDENRSLMVMKELIAPAELKEGVMSRRYDRRKLFAEAYETPIPGQLIVEEEDTLAYSG